MILSKSASLSISKKNPLMAVPTFSFKIMLKPNRLSQSYEILHEEKVGYVLLGKSNLNFQQ